MGITSVMQLCNYVDFCNVIINHKKKCMKKFVIERNPPGAGSLLLMSYRLFHNLSCEVVSQLGKPYHWIQSFVTDDKIYCVRIAENEEMIREHASLGKFSGYFYL
jgi:hypothetical protein